MNAKSALITAISVITLIVGLIYATNLHHTMLRSIDADIAFRSLLQFNDAENDSSRYQTNDSADDGSQAANYPQRNGEQTVTQRYHTTVNADEYHSFWIWNAPSHANLPAIQQATELYILQGEVRPELLDKSSANPNMLTRQGTKVLDIPEQKVWLVYRTTSTDWDDSVIQQIVSRLQQWQSPNNQVMGLQIDFDAPTQQLDGYVDFLRMIRSELPSQYQLSVTGLLDWSNQAQSTDMKDLGSTIDELVMQTYQGTQTIDNYEGYLNKLMGLPFRFKLGLVERGQWLGKSDLENDGNFAGYVVFLH